MSPLVEHYKKANAWLERALWRIDPCDDPEAEKLSPWALITFFIALTISLSIYWKFKFQPMQDVGHHVAHSAIVADFSRPGSLYPSLYFPPDPLLANSFLYTVAGYLGKLTGVTFAFRLCMSFYLAGVPLANLYALRVFGRSAWPAILAVPLVYGMNWFAGFANLLFAGPFLVISIPLFYRAITKPTPVRTLVASFTIACTFLSHAHVFLWLGALTMTITFIVAMQVVLRSLRHREGTPRVLGGTLRDGTREAIARVSNAIGANLRVGILALLAVIPAMGLFSRWYKFAFGEARTQGAVTAVTSGWDNHYGAHFHTTDGLFYNIYTYCLKLFTDDADLLFYVKVMLVCGVAVTAARRQKWTTPPILELMFLMTFGSYFYLPESIDTNPVVGSRQMAMSFWFAAVFATPVLPSVSRILRGIVIAGIVIVSFSFLSVYKEKVVDFQKKEVDGLEYVLDGMPYRKTLAYVKIFPDTSTVFTWKPNWHVEKYYMADKFGQCPDNPAIVSTSSIRYLPTVDPHRLDFNRPNWPMSDIWKYYDGILVRGWIPTPEQLEAAKEKGVLIRKQGQWQLWRAKGPWQETGDGMPPHLP